MNPQIPMWQPVKQALVLAAITGATFLPTLSSKFVYDARMQIATGDFIHDPWNWLPVLSGRVLAMDVLDFNRPAQLASLMLDASLWGRDPFGFHLTSVLLHVLNVLLLWGVMRALPAPAAALPEPRAVATDLVHFLAALAFAVHPVVTEAVCEPTFREDVLVAACTLGALLLAMHHDPAAARGERRRALACVGLCLLAVASKETGVATPAVLAAYWWMFRRGDPRPFWTLAVGGGLLAAAAFIAARFLLQPETSTIFESRPEYPGGSLQAALALEPRILALYAQLVVCPVNQCADYGAYSVRHLPLPVALAILAGLVAAAWRGIRGDRRIGLAVALIVLPLLPVSNLVPIYRAAADRYLYLPLAGAALWLGWFLDGAWLAARSRLREALGVGMVAMLIALGLACVERQAVWADPLSLWEDTARKNPAAYTPALGLGEALRELGRLPESERAIREAIRISAGQRGDAWAMLALVLDAQGRGADARAAVEKALAVQPNLADPAARVRALAMERAVAEDWTRLLENTKAR